MLRNEEWRPVAGWPYEVSSIGRVRRSRPGKRTKVGKIRRLALDSYGYPQVSLYRVHRGKPEEKTCKVHTLVAEAFHGPRPSGQQINHKNGTKTDNRPENLEWVTGSENQLHAVAHGLFAKQHGEHNPAAKITETDVREIRRMRKRGERMSAIAEEFGISVPNVSMIVNRQRWAHVA